MKFKLLYLQNYFSGKFIKYGKHYIIFDFDVFPRISGSLLETLHTCDAGDIIIIGKGIHQIKGAGNLEDGGTIKGICNLEHTILNMKDIESAPSLLDFSGSEVNIYLYMYICLKLICNQL